MAAEGRKEGLYDLSNVVAFGQYEQWRPKAAKVATKLAKTSPVGNAGPSTRYRMHPYMSI